jgi:hypothetical protein
MMPEVGVEVAGGGCFAEESRLRIGSVAKKRAQGTAVPRARSTTSNDRSARVLTGDQEADIRLREIRLRRFR